jgi:hypothetical protein
VVCRCIELAEDRYQKAEVSFEGFLWWNGVDRVGEDGDIPPFVTAPQT